MRIGVDIDDVLVDALPHFLSAFNARFGKAVPLEQADWDIFRAFPEIPPPARRAIARLPWHRAPTLEWLASQGLGEAFADLLIKQPRLSREKHKREAAVTLKLEAFVEDERRTAEALATLPLTVFLLARLPTVSGIIPISEHMRRTVTGSTPGVVHSRAKPYNTPGEGAAQCANTPLKQEDTA